MSDAETWKRAWERERQARIDSEEQLEESTRRLYLKNQELEKSREKLIRQQAAMLKQEKLATIGMLSAGVAHEINNPLAVVISNLSSLKEYNEQLLTLLKQNQHWLESDALPDSISQAYQALDQKYDFSFIADDAPELLGDMKEGLDRVRDIVSHMKRFSRTQPGERVLSDLNETVHSALKLVNNEIKDHCQVLLDLKPLPEMALNPSELSQVFMNLIINASHAVSKGGKIQILSRCEEEKIIISVTDNGCGMPQDVAKNIFNPFFTTKPPGQGTGMGLAVVYGIVEDHQGSIRVASQEGKGTRFTLSFPVISND